MTTPTEGQIIAAMAQYGGSFAKALAAAWMRADADNAARLREAFPHLLAQYASFVQEPAA